jgi:murein DD-endopeptidase MepM/ murein hydrolase activator NlpD
MRISMPSACFGFNSSKLVMAGIMAALLSGCSDSIERFSSNYNNPSDSDPVYTASVPQSKKLVKQTYAKPKALAYEDQSIAESPIKQAPLYKPAAPKHDYVQSYKKPYKQPAVKAPTLAYQQEPAAPVYTKPAYKAPAYKAPSFNTEDVVADSQTPAAPAQTFTYKKPGAKPASIAAATVRVGPGMTLYSIAKANGMTVQQLAQANGIAQPYTVSTGRVLRIPGATTAQMPSKKVNSLAAEEQSAQVEAPVKKAGSTYAVQSGDTLYSLGRKFGVSPLTIASANGLSKEKALSLGQKLNIPAGGTMATAQLKKPVTDQETISDDSDQQVADATPATKPGALALPKPITTAQDVPAIPTNAGSGLAMRWPVRGKVISEFGTKPSGLKNEGINISVPEGTSVRAAESGVVAYAGNELKGYGNLVLIRHAGGYVTAYAHAKSLNVKRGDTVKRGDVIAIAGQTGAVQSPQLHFEVRKGAVALDPTKYLSASTASN